MKRTSNAFTMAEILISLTIIGVIAALTLPALMANLNEKVWNTQRKALHSRMAQALAAMPRLDGYQENSEGSADYNFILNGLTTSLNITKVCEHDRMNKCDFSYPMFSMTDDELTKTPDVSSFITINGESIGVLYNPTCTGGSVSDFLSSNDLSNFECATFIYDLNGNSKGPNKVGKDMGIISAFFPEYPLVVAPMPMAGNPNKVNSEQIEEYLAENSDYRLPSLAEVSTMLRSEWAIGADYDGVSLWSDNDIFCNNDGTCTRNSEGSAALILVSKNGDAPRTFKILNNKDDGVLVPDMPFIDPRCPNGGVWYCGTLQDPVEACYCKKN